LNEDNEAKGGMDITKNKDGIKSTQEHANNPLSPEPADNTEVIEL